MIERVHDHNHAIATGRWQLVHRAQRFRDSGLSPEGEPPPRVCLRTGSGDSYGSQPHVLGTFHRGCRNQHCSVRLPVLTLRYAQIWHCQRKHNRDYDGRHCFQSHRIPLDSIRAYHQRATTHGRGQWSRDAGLTLAPVSQDMHSISAVL